MAKLTDFDHPLHGLLECPLRQGFIEFEYYPGDLVSKLITLADAAWETPRKAIHQEYSRIPKGIYIPQQEWVILCQDDFGSYRLFNIDDEIPIKVPERKKHSWLDQVRSGIEDYMEFIGIIHSIDIYNMAGHKWSISISNKRAYEVPCNNNSVLMLAVIVGRFH